jgi:hypothetical protein
MIGDVAAFRHSVIAVVQRSGQDHRHQAVFVGDLLGVARLQWRQRRKEAALPFHQPEDLGDIAGRQLGVEAGLQRLFRIELEFAL